MHNLNERLRNMSEHTPFYRHFKNLRRTIRETKTYNASRFQESCNPDWAKKVEDETKSIDLCDIEAVCASIGEIAASTLPLIRGFGPALNWLPKTTQSYRSFSVSHTETNDGFELQCTERRARLRSTLLYAGGTPPQTESEVTIVTKEGCPTVQIEGDWTVTSFIDEHLNSSDEA